MKYMTKQQKRNIVFRPQSKNHYRIRKFSVGLASVLFGTFLVYANPAEAAETEAAPPPQAEKVNQPSTTLTENIDQAPKNKQPETSEISQLQNQQPKENPTDQPPIHTENQATLDNKVVTQDKPTETLTSLETTKTPVHTETQKPNYHAPSPEVNATSIPTVKDIQEQVYSKSVTVYPASKAAKTAKEQRGINQARESLGLIVPKNKKLHIRQGKGSNEANLRVDLMTDDNQQIKNATVSNNGSWTEVSTGIDSAAFLRIPTGLKRNPIVEYYVEDDAGITLPTFRKNGDQQAFIDDWKARKTPYGYVEGDKIAFLIPKIDLPRIEKFGVKPSNLSFKNLDDMIIYYEDIIKHYDEWVGLNEDINSIHYNVPQKYFTIADKHGYGLAYYSSNLMGSNNPSMYGYLEKGWLSLHEVGHGYDGIMVNDEKMNLMEVENNILANQYQTTVMGIDNGWLYEGHQESTQRNIHNRIINLHGTFKFGNIGYRERLDFMTKMVRLIGIEGFTEMWKGIRAEEAVADRLHIPFNQDVPRWINTYWLANHGVNGTAYFDLYNIELSQNLKDELSAYNNSFAYPLAMLIQDKAELQRIKQKLNLATEYELVKSSDLADTSVYSNAEITLNLNDQTLAENVKVSLLENGKEVAQATVQDGKVVFPHLRAGVYQIEAPLTLDNALPRSQYLIVKEKGNNQAVLDYPTYKGTQSNVAQRLSLRGLSDREFAYADYYPDKKKVEFVENSGKPHLYFTDEYAHVKIEKADGTVLLDKSLAGNRNFAYKIKAFNLDYGDKIIVRHREPAARRKVVRKETNEDLVFPYASNEIVTYTLTDKGYIINNETEADANRRYSTAITSDVDKIAVDIKAHPDRDYRTRLFHILQGTKYTNDALKDELEGILQPFAEKYYVKAPVVNHIEKSATTITGEGQPESTIVVTFPNQTASTVEVDTEGKWKINVPEGLYLEHNDVTLVKAIGALGSTSNEVKGKVEDSIRPAAPYVNAIETGMSEITGTSEPNSSVFITIPGEATVEVEADNEGKWKLETNNKLSYGSTIEVSAKDSAGNSSENVTILVQDTVAPELPTINNVKSTDTEVTGTAEPNSQIIIELSDGNVWTTEADNIGQWRYELDGSTSLKGDTLIKVTAADKASNQSSKAESIVENIVMPLPNESETAPSLPEEPMKNEENIELPKEEQTENEKSAELKNDETQEVIEEPSKENHEVEKGFQENEAKEEFNECGIEEVIEEEHLENNKVEESFEEETHNSQEQVVEEKQSNEEKKETNSMNQTVTVKENEPENNEVTENKAVGTDESEKVTIPCRIDSNKGSILNKDKQDTQNLMIGTKHGITLGEPNTVTSEEKDLADGKTIKENLVGVRHPKMKNNSIYQSKPEETHLAELPMTGVLAKGSKIPGGLLLIFGLTFLGIIANRKKKDER
ncbi:YSIRK-type signal peptide-containing protein [Staphylococcus debuckii]|nr:YSIRK-type signal peptide-containing protein [Staphylococcus debuckii]